MMSKVIEIQLSEIHDIGWPVDNALVQSFRSTLQAGGDVPIILVNICYSEDGWYYEVIDGLHRLAAKQLEGWTSMIAQVVEVDERTARLQRIQACMGKPAVVTTGRAEVELRRVFRDDILKQVGTITTVYEPVLTEEGKRSKRVRQEPLPEDPIELLYVLGEHIRLLEDEAEGISAAAYTSINQFNYFHRFHFGNAHESPAPAFVGWEQIIRDWVASITTVFPAGREVIVEIIKHGAWNNGRRVSGHEKDDLFYVAAAEVYQIPDVDIRRIVLRRPADERSLRNLAYELNWDRLNYPSRHIARSEQIRLLTSMRVHEVVYKLQDERKKQEQAERKVEWDKDQRHEQELLAAQQKAREDAAASTVVFAAASPQFLAPVHAHVIVPQQHEATIIKPIAIPTEVSASPELTLQGLVQRLCREPGWVLFAYNNGTTIDMVAGDSRRSPEMLHEITDRVQRIDIPDPAAPPKKKGAR